MLKNVRKTIDGNANHCNKELSTIKRSQSKLDNSIAKMKTKPKAINSKLNEAAERISDLEDIIMEIR